MSALRKKKRDTKRGWFNIALPATSANLGPAFDAAALALSMCLRVRAKQADEFSITARGCDADICGRAKDHLILTTYCGVLDQQRKPVLPLELQLENEIPLGKGCGSSAAARLAGIALANHFGKLKWADARIICEAGKREGHVDNAAACWAGGLAIARMAEDDEIQVARIRPKGKWPLLLAVPDESFATEQARKILPQQYSRADAVANIQNSMLLVAAFTLGRTELLAAALEDHMHQPYRAPFCPLLPALQKFASKEVLGAVLSGAGPSVLIFLHPRARLRRVKPQIQAHLRTQGLKATIIDVKITSRGASGSLR